METSYDPASMESLLDTLKTSLAERTRSNGVGNADHAPKLKSVVRSPEDGSVPNPRVLRRFLLLV